LVLLHHLLRGLASMSPGKVVGATGPTGIAYQGVSHRCLQVRWWALLVLLASPPRGFIIDVSK
jgi:hypothetical protein